MEKVPFDVAVLAPMSSGKSTLLNALLRTNLLPTSNEATTAKVTTITDCDGTDGFTVQCRNEAGKVIHEKCAATPELIHAYNSEEKVFFIDIAGDIPAIAGSEARLQFVDTPGPNNSSTETHREIMQKVLLSKTTRLILFVLDATKPQVDDEAFLLQQIADVLKEDGNEDRHILYVINKVDNLDEEIGETIPKVKKNVRNYLKRLSLPTNPIIPVQARAAVLYNKQSSGEELSPKEKMYLKAAACDRDLSSYADLTQDCRDSLEELRLEADRSTEQMIACGITGLELTIGEYCRERIERERNQVAEEKKKWEIPSQPESKEVNQKVSTGRKEKAFNATNVKESNAIHYWNSDKTYCDVVLVGPKGCGKEQLFECLLKNNLLSCAEKLTTTPIVRLAGGSNDNKYLTREYAQDGSLNKRGTLNVDGLKEAVEWGVPKPFCIDVSGKLRGLNLPEKNCQLIKLNISDEEVSQTETQEILQKAIVQESTPLFVLFLDADKKDLGLTYARNFLFKVKQERFAKYTVKFVLTGIERSKEYGLDDIRKLVREVRKKAKQYSVDASEIYPIRLKDCHFCDTLRCLLKQEITPQTPKSETIKRNLKKMREAPDLRWVVDSERTDAESPFDPNEYVVRRMTPYEKAMMPFSVRMFVPKDLDEYDKVNGLEDLRTSINAYFDRQ